MPLRSWKDKISQPQRIQPDGSDFPRDPMESTGSQRFERSCAFGRAVGVDGGSKLDSMDL